METLTESSNPPSERCSSKPIAWELTNTEDLQWKSVETAIAELIAEYVPEQHREGFSFHATELYHCSGKIFHHTKYPRERAREALKQLISIPRRFQLPISVGYITKTEQMTQTRSVYSARQKAQFFHGLAYILCVIAAEIYMMQKGSPDELARLVAENNTDTHKTVKFSHQVLQGKIHSDVLDNLTAQHESMRSVLPIRRIVDTIHFVEKDDAILLQLADACAFILRYWAESRSGEYVDPYFEAFAGEHLESFLAMQRPAFFHGTWTFQD
jgi:hypothetical protein